MRQDTAGFAFPQACAAELAATNQQACFVGNRPAPSRLRPGKLPAPKAVVRPLPGDQIRRPAVFGDTALVNDQDLVQVGNRGQAMGDDDDRLPLHHLVQTANAHTSRASLPAAAGG